MACIYTHNFENVNLILLLLQLDYLRCMTVLLKNWFQFTNLYIMRLLYYEIKHTDYIKKC